MVLSLSDAPELFEVLLFDVLFVVYLVGGAVGDPLVVDCRQVGGLRCELLHFVILLLQSLVVPPDLAQQLVSVQRKHELRHGLY